MHFLTFVYGNNAAHQLIDYEIGGDTSFVLEPLRNISVANNIPSMEETIAFIAGELKSREPILLVDEDMLKEECSEVAWRLVDHLKVGAGTILACDNKGQIKRFTYVSSNGRWDWYEIGGRWAGRLWIKEGVEPPEVAIKAGDRTFKIPEDLQARYGIGKASPIYSPKQYDALPKGLLDIDAMIEHRFPEKMRKEAEAIFKIAKNHTFKPLQTFLKDPDGEGYAEITANHREATKQFEKQPAVKALAGEGYTWEPELGMFFAFNKCKDLMTYLTRKAWLPNSSLRQNQWVDADFVNVFDFTPDLIKLQHQKLDHFNAAKDDELLTVVDCHC